MLIKLQESLSENVQTYLAAYFAKQMGVPFGKFICASNHNNVLTDFFTNGNYNRNRPFFQTISPSAILSKSSSTWAVNL